MDVIARAVQIDDVFPNGTYPYGVYPNCTLKVDCDMVWAQIEYYPSLEGNAFYLAFFAVLLGTQIIQGICWKAWSYSIAMAVGLLLECAGYGARIGLSQNPFDFTWFVINLVALTIAPVFFTAAIYISLARLIPFHDPSNTYSRLKPVYYTYCFLTADIISLILQAAGGALAASASTDEGTDQGVDIMIAGLVFQVVSLVVFSYLCAEFAWKLKNSVRTKESPSSDQSVHTKKSGIGSMEQYELALVAATVFVLARCCFRCAELADGFSGELANEEVPFMVLEGGMISCACLIMTIWCPGWCLKGLW